MEDVNDNAPEFVENSLLFTVEERSKVGETFFRHMHISHTHTHTHTLGIHIWHNRYTYVPVNDQFASSSLVISVLSYCCPWGKCDIFFFPLFVITFDHQRELYHSNSAAHSNSDTNWFHHACKLYAELLRKLTSYWLAVEWGVFEWRCVSSRPL